MFEPCRSVNSLCVLCDSALKSICSTRSTRLNLTSMKASDREEQQRFAGLEH